METAGWLGLVIVAGLQKVLDPTGSTQIHVPEIGDVAMSFVDVFVSLRVYPLRAFSYFA